MADLPNDLRALLQGHMMEVMPPSEILQQISNRRKHDHMSQRAANDFMLNTLVLMQLAFVMEHYGNEHPSVSKLIGISNTITARNS